MRTGNLMNVLSVEAIVVEGEHLGLAVWTEGLVVCSGGGDARGRCARLLFEVARIMYLHEPVAVQRHLGERRGKSRCWESL